MNGKIVLKIVCLLTLAVVFLPMIGCRPQENKIQEAIVKSVFSMNCQGCGLQGVEGEDEGEGQTDGEEESEWEGETHTTLLLEDVSLEMIHIPAGSFQMGRYPGEHANRDWEDPQHLVTVAGFWIGKFEVTKRQWQAIMGTTPWVGQPLVTDNLDSPAMWVSWNDIEAFITALNTLTGQTFRLPSEAEWEYACRAGTHTRFYWGDDLDHTVGSNYEWWVYNTVYANPKDSGAHGVGLRLPNPWGLYDMSGNVDEWCEDDWHVSYVGAPSSGVAWVDSPRDLCRVIRGGSWMYDDTACRSASRQNGDKSYSDPFTGFRLAR